MGRAKRIMMIGAGPFQQPAIAKAKELGLEVVATDRDHNARGLRLADIPEVVDVKDIERSIAIAKKHRVDGVLSVVSELGVRTAAEVANALSLPGLTRAAAVAATDKVVMRQIFAEHGLPSPQFEQAETLAEGTAASEKLGLPVVVKPADSSGSRGVSKVEGVEQLPKAFNWAFENSAVGKVIIEDFVEGEELTIEALSYRGQHEILAMSGKTKIPFPYCVSIDLTYPPAQPVELVAEVRALAKKALTALGIDQGASHTEVLLAPEGPVLVESAARGGGFGVFSEIVPLVSGVDIVEQCVNIAMGFEPDIRRKQQKAAVLRFFTPTQGRIRGISGLDNARRLSGVQRIELDVHAGDRIRQIRRDGERPGLMIVSGETREQAIVRADAVEQTVHFDMEEVTA